MRPQEFERLQEIERRLEEHPFAPQLVVENTSHCNLKCAHCSHRELIRPRKHMDRALWNKIVEEVGAHFPDTELWPTFYGEAFVLGDELWDRLDHAARAGCRNLVLNSNGTLLERKGGLEKILSSPLKRFIVSLDGFTAPVFESIRVGANRDSVYRQVEALLDLKRARGQTYPVIICQFSRMEQNQHEVEAFRAHWSARGAEVKVRRMLEWTASGSVRCADIEHGVEQRIACPWANNTMAIHQNGDVVACAVDYEGRFTVGNARDTGVRELWQRLGVKLRELHRAHQWDALPDLCRGCGDWQVAGAQYEREKVSGSRPFWFADAGRA